MVKQVTENLTPTLREMNVGDMAELPVKVYHSVKSVIIPRLEFEKCVENAKWWIQEKKDVDRKKGTFKVKRIA